MPLVVANHEGVAGSIYQLESEPVGMLGYTSVDNTINAI